MADGIRFAGLDELLVKLDTIRQAWEMDGALAKVAFLVGRCTADFETSIEAALSGYPRVAAVAMRDVMEIELLLLDFYMEPERMDRWLTESREVLQREFWPAVVRRRLIRLGLHDVIGTPRVAADYAAHSESLHVSPHPPPLPVLAKGHVASSDVLSLDYSFIEIFEHGRRLGNALLLVAHRMSPDTPADVACHGPLPAFELAHARTQETAGKILKAVRDWADAAGDDRVD